jgi:hypothetical protein
LSRRRAWLISPEGFRELRHACLLGNRKAAAKYLGVCERTIRHWDSGRSRVPWSAVRLLRLLRCGDLGALHDDWSGWTINRLGLHSPNGYVFQPWRMATWPMVAEQARFWRQDYDRRAGGGAGAVAPASAGARPQAGSTLPAASQLNPAALATPAKIPATPPRQTALGAMQAQRAGFGTPTAACAERSDAQPAGRGPGLVYIENKSPGTVRNRMASRFAQRQAGSYRLELHA